MRAVRVLWLSLAMLNLLAGIVIASHPGRQSDLDSMRRRGAEWLVDGANVYAIQDQGAAYPPNGIVAFSPLALLPRSEAIVFWAVLNLILTVLAPYLAVRAVVGPMRRYTDAMLPVAMFICWGGFRTLLQFTLLPLTIGLLAMNLSPKRPWSRGACVGLALIKPQVGLPFLLWAAFRGGLRAVSVAVGVVAAGVLLFCLRAGAGPMAVAVPYFDVLRNLLSGQNALAGISEVRPLIAAVVRDTPTIDLLATVFAAFLLVVICVLTVKEARRKAGVLYSVPALAAMWPLVNFRHLTYGFIVLLPCAALLLLVRDPATTTIRRRLFWVLQVALMFDLPGLWRLVRLTDSFPGISTVVGHADRVLMLSLFVGVAALSAQSGTGWIGPHVKSPREEMDWRTG